MTTQITRHLLLLIWIIHLASANSHETFVPKKQFQDTQQALDTKPLALLKIRDLRTTTTNDEASSIETQTLSEEWIKSQNIMKGYNPAVHFVELNLDFPDYSNICGDNNDVSNPIWYSLICQNTNPRPVTFSLIRNKKIWKEYIPHGCKYNAFQIVMFVQNALQELNSQLHHNNENEVNPESFQAIQDVAGYIYGNITVPVIQWSPEYPFAEYVIENRTPVVLRQTAVEKWPARTLWNPDYVGSHLPNMLKVNHHTSNVFTYYEKTQPMADLSEISWKSPSVTSVMGSRDFMKRLKDPQPREDGMNHMYFSGNMVDFKKLNKDITPFDWFTVKVGSQEVDPIKMLWIGSNHVTAQTHYDSLHNFFVQLHGEQHKRFILSPPSAFRHLYLYPALHPSYRQSQVDFTNVDSTKFPNFKNIPAVSVLLEPGDVLYLPPHWFHRVIAEDLSISVSVWSDSEEIQLYYDRIQAAPLPFEQEWTFDQKAVAVTRFVTGLVTKLGFEANQFVKDTIWNQRYAPIFGTLQDSDMQTKCKTPQPSAWLDSFSSNCEAKLDTLVPLFEEVRSVAGGDIEEILLASYIETVTNFMLGVENVALFFCSCFT